MEWIVQLGFELDIYQVDELAGMYWYAILINADLHLSPLMIELTFSGLGICSIWHTRGYNMPSGCDCSPRAPLDGYGSLVPKNRRPLIDPSPFSTWPCWKPRPCRPLPTDFPA